jgi:hypothetical protein
MCKHFIYLAFAVFCLSLIPKNVARADLIGWWKLDEGSGDTTYDSSGNGNHGTLTEGTAGFPEWKTAIGDFRVGTAALEFHAGTAAAEGDLVDCGNSEIFNITENITFALWVKVEVFTMTYQYVFSKGFNYMILRAGDTPYLRVVFNGLDAGDGDDYYAGGTTIPIDDGQWHYVAGSYDSSTGVVAFYTDGILEESKISSGSLPTNEEPVCIGNRYTRKGADAIIDDVRLYNHTLSAVEILSAMYSEPFPFASGPSPEDGAVNFDTWVNLSWRPGESAVSHDLYLGEVFDAVSEGAEGTFIGNQVDTFIVVGFPGFPYPDGLVPGTTYYWRVDEVNDTEPNSPWKGDVWSFSVPPKTAYAPDPADGGQAVAVDTQLSWTPGFGAKLHTVYFGDNFDEVDNATGGQSQGIATYSPNTLEMAKTYYWRVDEFDVVETHKGDVWSFTTEGAVGSPNPANGAVDVTQIPTLTWVPGVFADIHDVYFGADEASLELKGSGNLGAESFEPGQLEWKTTYYWRVDEANNANADSPWTGPLWSFTTANFLIIDDMESYNDLDEGDSESNRIYLAWIDGFDNPAVNGCIVGYANAPFAEQSTVHGGNQSMPFEYNNAVGKSEATLTLTSNRDWTVKSVNTLTIWYRGGSANAAETMYVALNGNSRVDHVESDAAQKGSWTQWNIPLQAFADQGVNLANVTSITLGLSSVTGGSGMMYFDDIRLYAP